MRSSLRQRLRRSPPDVVCTPIDVTSSINPLLLSEMTPWDRFLMGLCMCSSCIYRASEIGFDASGFKREVAEFLERSLPRLPGEKEFEAAVDDDRIAEAFGGRLQRVIGARIEIASSLFEDIVDKVKSQRDIKTRMGPLDASMKGLSPSRVRPLIGEMEVGNDPETISREKLLQPNTAIFGTAVPTSYRTKTTWCTVSGLRRRLVRRGSASSTTA